MGPGRAVYVLSTTLSIVGITKFNGKIKIKHTRSNKYQETIEWYQAQILPHDCGWMNTTISGLKTELMILKESFHRIQIFIFRP